MIPRRLLTVMLLLLVGLVIASAVAPPPERREQDAARTTTSTTPKPASTATQQAAAAPSGVDAVLPADGTVRARPGQAIELAVTSKQPATIEIPELGAMQPAAPGAPAQFVVAFDAAGRYDVRDLEADASVGTVEIGE